MHRVHCGSGEGTPTRRREAITAQRKKGGNGRQGTVVHAMDERPQKSKNCRAVAAVAARLPEHAAVCNSLSLTIYVGNSGRQFVSSSVRALCGIAERNECGAFQPCVCRLEDACELALVRIDVLPLCSPQWRASKRPR